MSTCFILLSMKWRVQVCVGVCGRGSGGWGDVWPRAQFCT